VFDNVNGPIGNEDLDRLITASVWSDRILGASDAPPPLPNVTVWMATGNNIEPVRDTVRRCLFVRIETDAERPQERTGFKIPNLPKHVADRRGELLSGALTILRAYHIAGRPGQNATFRRGAPSRRGRHWCAVPWSGAACLTRS
jgi:putative DNA primase/helicase